ncbi:MAG TPA: hypothetical protein DHM37_08855 [Candidatus Cloacimonas sp.]|nr:hypothetical protein [Candidatus Cloacimonas sp.]
MKKNTLLAKLIIIIYLFFFVKICYAYTANTHQYIVEQAYELLKAETGISYIEFDEGIYSYNENWDPAIIKGVIEEDETDWTNHYHINDPEFEQELTNEILEAFGQVGLFPSVTHFWNADNGIINDSFLNGEMFQIDWSLQVDNAYVKAKRYLEGYEGNEPYWITAPINTIPIQDVFDSPYPSLTYQYVFSEPFGLHSLFQTGKIRLYDLVPPGIQGDLITHPTDTFYFGENYRKHMSLNILGRIIHLLSDMSVPAHVHNDEHAPRKLTVTGSWHTEYCDNYEGWIEHGSGGLMAFEDNYFWNYENILLEKGGHIDITNENDPLFYLMYTVNQIADFFASDDKDGDINLPQGTNTIINAMYQELNTQYPIGHPVRTAHSLTMDECAQIRDTVFPFVIRATAGVLQWFAEENNLAPIYLSRHIIGSVTLNDEEGIITDVTIKFDKHNSSNDIVIQPDSNGNFTCMINSEDFGIYDVIFSLEGYYPRKLYNIQISGNLDILQLEPVTLSKLNPSLIVVNKDLSNHNSFHTITEALSFVYNYDYGYNGVYTPEVTIVLGRCTWEEDISLGGLMNIDLTIKGYQGDVSIIDGSNSNGTGVTIGSMFDNCKINLENLVIQNWDRGVLIDESYGEPDITINNCIIQNNSDNISNGSGIKIYAPVTIKNCELLNNSLDWSISYPDNGFGAAVYAEIADGSVVIENNLIKGNKGSEGTALYLTGAAEFYVNNNQLIGNEQIMGSGYNAYPGDAAAVFIEDASNCVFERNTIAQTVFENNKSTSRSALMIVYCENVVFNNNSIIDNASFEGVNFSINDNLEMHNNLIANNARAMDLYSNYNHSFSYNCLWNNTINSYDGYSYSYNIVGNPHLLPFNETTHTYGFEWSSINKSPCIDSGDPAETWDADGTPPDIGAVPAVNHRYDQVSLPPTTVDNGIKWLSFPALDVVRDSADIAENVLTDILDINILYQMEASDYTIRYLSGSWENTDEQLTRTDGYKFKMLDSAQFDISGFKVPDNTKISLQSGSAGNWVGYWLEDTQSVFDALDGYLDDIYMVQAQHWSILKSGSTWLVTTDKGYSPTLSYADMAIIKCSTAIPKFTWNNSTVPEQPLEVAEPEYYIYSEQASYIPIFVELENSQKELPDEIGAFANGDCVGAAVVTDTLVMVPAYRSQGPIELEMYFADNKEKSSIANYRCYAAGNEAVVMEKLPDKLRAEAYVVSLDPASELIPNTLKFSLENYPNPFNPTTTIFYTQPQTGSVSLEIFNIKGQKVRTLVNSHQASGSYQAVWNGRDDAGRQAASGIYFYKLQTPGYTTMKKMLLLK